MPLSVDESRNAGGELVPLERVWPPPEFGCSHEKQEVVWRSVRI